MSIPPSVCLAVFMSVPLSLSLWLSVYISLRLSVSLFPSVCLSVCLSVERCIQGKRAQVPHKKLISRSFTHLPPLSVCLPFAVCRYDNRPSSRGSTSITSESFGWIHTTFVEGQKTSAVQQGTIQN